MCGLVDDCVGNSFGESKLLWRSTNILKYCTVKMFFADKIQARIGTFSCVLLGLCAYAARCLFYQGLHSMPSPWLVKKRKRLIVPFSSSRQSRLIFKVLLIEPMHGITFGIFYAACVTYVSRGIATERTQATFQGIFFGLMSCGRSVGAILGG